MKGLSGTGQSGRESELGKEGGKEGGRKPCLALAEACGLGNTHRLVPPSSRFLHRCPSLSSSSSILHNTHAVYEKGAEVIRLYHTLLGAEGFRKGMDLYFQRHDGQVCVCVCVCVCKREREGGRAQQKGGWVAVQGIMQLPPALRKVKEQGGNGRVHAAPTQTGDVCVDMHAQDSRCLDQTRGSVHQLRPAALEAISAPLHHHSH